MKRVYLSISLVFCIVLGATTFSLAQDVTNKVDATQKKSATSLTQNLTQSSQNQDLKEWLKELKPAAGVQAEEQAQVRKKALPYWKVTVNRKTRGESTQSIAQE